MNVVINEDKVLSVIKSRTDERELRETKNQLKERRDLYRRLFENSRDAIYVTQKNGKFVEVNPAFIDLFGYTKNELRRLNALSLYEDPDKRRVFVNQMERDEFVKDFEVKLRRSNGTIIDCFISADARTSQDGTIIGFQGMIHDVTDKKRAEKEVKNFKWTLDNTLDSVFMFDTKSFKITYVNKGVIKQVGYSEEELMKMTPLDFKPEFSEESFRAKISPLIDHSEKSLTFEDIHKRKDGELIPVEVFLQHSAPPGGKPQFIAIVRDISDRKEKDELVRKLSYAIDQSASSVLITDTDGIIEYVNPKFEKMTGYTFDDVKGKTPRILKSGETPREEYEKLWNTILSGKEWKGEFHNKRKNGELYWERTSISPIRNATGVITHFLGIKEDITERKKVQDKLQQSEERFRSLVDSAVDAIISIDEEGNIVSWNIASEKIFGYSAKELIGKSLGKIVPESYRNAHQEGLKHLIQSGESRIIGKTIKVEALRKNGSKFPIELSLSTWKSESKTFFTGIIKDITEGSKVEERLQKEHELVLEANKELKKAFAKEEKLRTALTNAEKLASLGEMASKIAHEINNPLTVIKGQAELRAQMVSDEALKNSLLTIKVKADQIKDLTRGYMNLAKPEETELTKIKLRDVLKATVRTLLPLGQLKNIKISEEYMKDEPSILGDPGRLEQVFRNLIINAVDATAEKSSSEIKIGTKLSEDGKSIDAYIKDNGVGIKPENIEKIFEPYYTKKERTAGTGLGLVIVKETTENVHGGRLEVESNLGEGTEFHVIIPSIEYSQMKKKLLIVDDDLSISGLLEQYFNNKGLNVTTAENGRVAIDCMNDFKPDLILSDIDMPYLDGIGLLEEVKKTNSDLPFVMMTGFDSRAHLRDELENKGVALILKPPDLEDELWPMIKEKLGIAN